MLEQILDYIHNYFVYKEYSGVFTISDGRLEGDSGYLLDGQYFKIEGSVLNDGLYEYPGYMLTDEEFEGKLLTLAIPPALLNIAQEISEWVEKNSKVINNPYNSESFGGYSYSKANSSNGGAFGWKDMFGGKLNRWRKIS